MSDRGRRWNGGGATHCLLFPRSGFVEDGGPRSVTGCLTVRRHSGEEGAQWRGAQLGLRELTATWRSAVHESPGGPGSPRKKFFRRIRPFLLKTFLKPCFLQLRVPRTRTNRDRAERCHGQACLDEQPPPLDFKRSGALPKRMPRCGHVHIGCGFLACRDQID